MALVTPLASMPGCLKKFLKKRKKISIIKIY